MNIESIPDPVVYRMVKRDELKTQLATIIGVVAGVAIFIITLLSFRLYKYLALFLGIWQEPSGIDVAMAVLVSPFFVALIAAVVRGILIYKWVAR